MPDAIFDHPRLAAVYDPLDPDRSDLDAYAAIVAELEAISVLDVGCGTGTFACLLAELGIEVVGVDPAAASLDVARGKPGADRVRWILGDATTLPPLQVDLATMTGNVAQVFLTDDGWSATLAGIVRALGPGGRLVFETRVPDVPERDDWRAWNREKTAIRMAIDGVGEVESWGDRVEVAGDLVSFRSTTRFVADGAVLESHSTLRFRTRQQVHDSLTAVGLELEEVRDAPDRPSREYVFVARRPD